MTKKKVVPHEGYIGTKHCILVRPYKPTEASLGSDWYVKLKDEHGGCLNTWSFNRREDALKAYEASLEKVGAKFIEACMSEFESLLNLK